MWGGLDENGTGPMAPLPWSLEASVLVADDFKIFKPSSPPKRRPEPPPPLRGPLRLSAPLPLPAPLPAAGVA